MLERDILIEPWFSISLNGKVVGEDMLKFIGDVEVDDEEDKLPIATISVIDSENIWVNDVSIIKGTSISVSMGHKKSNVLMFSGRITNVDADMPQEGYSTLIISAVDSGIKLMEARKARSFKKMKVSEVINKMFKESGIKGEVVDTKVVLAHIAQEDESNLEFITRWRKKLKWNFYKVAGTTNTFYFGNKRKNSKVESLGYKTAGMEIISFTPSYMDLEIEEEKKSENIDNKGKVQSQKNTKAKPKTTSDPKKPVGKVK